MEKEDSAHGGLIWERYCKIPTFVSSVRFRQWIALKS